MIRAAAAQFKSARLSWLVTLLCLMDCTPGGALNPGRKITQYIQGSWNTESGLPQNSVHAITQTSDGYLWIGTEEGLSRFDGSVFTTYEHDNTPGLPSNYIQALAVSPNGTLWIGTDSGLTAFRRSKPGGSQGTFTAITTAEGLSGNNVTALWEASDGALWVGTTHGLNRIVAGRVEHWRGSGELTTASVSAICAGNGGILWIGTASGLYRIVRGEAHRFGRAGQPFNGAITSLAATPRGSIWVGTQDEGLFEVEGEKISVPAIPLPSKSIESLLVDKDGGLWIGFDRSGIGRLYGEKLDFYNAKQGLPSDRVTHAFYQDQEGSVWLGLLDAGLVQFRDGKFAVFGRPEGLSGNYVGNVLQAADGTMWIGADSNGLNHILADGRVEVWDHRQGLPRSAVFSLLESRDGSIWVGYRNGLLARIRGRQVNVYADPGTKDVSLNALFEANDGSIWLGFWGKGLVLFQNGRFEHIGGDSRISQFAQSPDGALWIATDGNGLQRFYQGQITIFDIRNRLPSNHVMSVYADQNGDIWAGTASGGLSRIRNGQVVTWTLRQGLPESTIGSILKDNFGNFWLGGDKGIYSISMDDLARTAGRTDVRLHPVQYDTTSGLRSRETLYGSMPCAWKARDGRLWFATIRGAAVIDPANIPTDKVVPPVWIDSAFFDSHSVPLRDGIRLGPGSGNLEIAFTSPSFVVPQRDHFRYRLLGFDPKWVNAGSRRRVWYTNLPPGKYSFAVQAENSDGVWNYAGASFQFVILPPLTRTPLAYACYLLLVILLIWAAVALRTRSLLLRQQELTLVVAERTAELQAEKTELEAARRELQIQASHDSLTGLFNRATIVEHLEREISRTLRENTTLGVAIADLDHFKNVNDNYGHLCGDQIIIQSAARFRSALRAYDIIGRYGGEEFLILFPGWNMSTAPKRVHDFLRAIGDHPFATDEAILEVTCSFGVAVFDPKSDDPAPEEVLRRADTALYVAKNSGRNCIRFDVRALTGSDQLIH